MAYGPIELLVVEFPGNQFSGEITPALKELVDSGLIRIIDILFIQKLDDGTVVETELTDLVDDVFTAFEPLVDEDAGEDFLSHDDALGLAESLDPGSSAGIMLFENVWATRFADAVRAADGQVVLNERIPRSVIEELVAEHAAAEE
jgi:hypothetical protein